MIDGWRYVLEPLAPGPMGDDVDTADGVGHDGVGHDGVGHDGVATTSADDGVVVGKDRGRPPSMGRRPFLQRVLWLGGGAVGGRRGCGDRRRVARRVPPPASRTSAPSRCSWTASPPRPSRW